MGERVMTTGRKKSLFSFQDLGASKKQAEIKYHLTRAEAFEEAATQVGSDKDKKTLYGDAAGSYGLAANRSEELGNYSAAEKYLEQAIHLDSRGGHSLTPYLVKDLKKFRQQRAVRAGQYLEERRARKGNKLEETAATAAVVGLIGAAFFLSPNFTGNVIGNLTNSSSNIIGVLFLVVALIAGYFWMKKKK